MRKQIQKQNKTKGYYVGNIKSWQRNITMLVAFGAGRMGIQLYMYFSLINKFEGNEKKFSFELITFPREDSPGALP